MPEDTKLCYMFDLFSEKISMSISRGRLNQCFISGKEVVPQFDETTLVENLVFHGARNVLR